MKSPTKKQNKVKSTQKLLKFDDPEQSYKYIINEFLSIGAMLICVYMKFALTEVIFKYVVVMKPTKLGIWFKLGF